MKKHEQQKAIFERVKREYEQKLGKHSDDMTRLERKEMWAAIGEQMGEGGITSILQGTPTIDPTEKRRLRSPVANKGPFERGGRSVEQIHADWRNNLPAHLRDRPTE